MAELEQLRRRLKEITAYLMQNERLIGLGELMAGVAHELNQPLNIIKIICQDILRDVEKNRFDAQKLPDDMREAIEQVSRLSDIIDHLRAFTRTTIGDKKQEVDVNQTIEGVFNLLGQQLRNHNIEVRKELAPDLPRVIIDQIKLEQVFMNIVKNARDAVERFRKEGIFIELRSFLETAKDKKEAVVSIKDNGGGVPENIRDKVFEAFFTTKEAGGIGLGLSVSKEIIAEAGGRIELEVEEGIGSTFKVFLSVENSSEYHNS